MKKEIKEEKINEEDAAIKKKTEMYMGGRRKRWHILADFAESKVSSLVIEEKFSIIKVKFFFITWAVVSIYSYRL